MNFVTVREYARLNLDIVDSDLDQATISPTAFEFLCGLNARMESGLLQVESRNSLRLANFVGVLETPCGTRIEILPKHVDDATDARPARRLLRKMLLDALDLDPGESDEASIELFRVPMSEWVMSRFLLELQRLVRRGIRFDYVRLEEEQRFLRGQWDVARQLRQRPGRDHIFQIRHDVFLPDRPENRLLRAALNKVCRATVGDAENWRISHELALLMGGIEASTNIRADFAAWSSDRMMVNYRAIQPWCMLVLGQEMPLALQGATAGLSILFPMEMVFERHVTAQLRRALRSGVRLDPQAARERESLCIHEGRPMFVLKPDFLFTEGTRRWVMDAKWKRVDCKNRGDKYDIDQADLYQLYAYGQKYLKGAGTLALVYPKTQDFLVPLPVFEFSDTLKLWALPFDLDAGRLLLPVGGGPWPVTEAVRLAA